MFLLLSFSIVLFTLCGLLRRRFETLLPILAGAMILLCYGLACFRKLAVFPWVLYALGLFCLGFLFLCLFSKERRAFFKALGQYAITPGLLAFLLLALFFFSVLREHAVYYTDDLKYWAVEVKSIWANGGLVDSYHHLAPSFMSYTPGIQLFQWIGLFMAGEFSESMMFIMLAIFYAIYLLPFAEKITWRKAYYLPLFLLFSVAFPTFLLANGYHLLQVDSALCLCLSCALRQTWKLIRQEKASLLDCFGLAIILSVLLLIKQSGALWALLAFSLLPLLGRRKSLPLSRQLVVLIIPALVFGSWLLFSALNQLQGMHLKNFDSSLTTLFVESSEGPKNTHLLSASIWGAFLFSYPDMSLLKIPLLGWALLPPLFTLVMARFEPDNRRIFHRLSLWWLVLCVALLIGFGFIMLTAFRPEFDSYICMDPPRLTGLMNRYLGVFWLGSLVLCLTIAMDSQYLQRFPRLTLTIALAGLLLFSNWKQLHLDFLSPPYDDPTTYEIFMLQEENFWTEDVFAELENPLDAVILYGVNPTPLRPERLQYAVAPLTIRTFYGDMNEEDMVRYFQHYHISHVLTVDDENPTHATASLFTEDEYIEPYLLYEVIWEEENRPLLVPAY